VEYDPKEPQEIDLSDLILSGKVSNGKSLPLELLDTWDSVPDFKLILLRQGLAQLRDVQSAPESYRTAQDRAKDAGLGIWATPTPTPTPPSSPLATQSSPEPPGTTSVNDVFNLIVSSARFIWGWIVRLAPVGFGGFLLWALYYFFWVRRRIRLLIIGLKSAGKTAVYWRLIDPTIDSNKILSLEPTKARQKIAFRRHIQYAKFEIYPRLTDVPGAAYSTVWDELTRFRWLRRHAMLLVLAPSMMNSKGENIPDTHYVATQLGYVQAFVEGSLSARKTRKPKVLILFLNKFDLISSHPPNDSAASDQRQVFLRAFSEHIESVERAIKRANIPYRLVIGSAVNNWNCTDLISVVGKLLFGS